LFRKLALNQQSSLIRRTRKDRKLTKFRVETLMITFHDRFLAANRPGGTLSLQLVFPDALSLDAGELGRFVRGYSPEMSEAIIELVRAEDLPTGVPLFSPSGPPVAVLGLISWGGHILKLGGFDAPMPYGPIASCVEPALMPPEVKRDAASHKSHVILYHGGPETDPFECYAALASLAGAMASLGATAILNEEARTAVPGFDLIPEPQEDIHATIRNLPLLYLFAGFVRTTVGAPERPWVRTFGCHLLNLPDLALQAHGYGEMSLIFQWFCSMLSYLRTTDASLEPGQIVALSEDLKLSIREPHPTELDFLHSEGTMLVLERMDVGIAPTM
jgi:hypothetical protein